MRRQSTDAQPVERGAVTVVRGCEAAGRQGDQRIAKEKARRRATVMARLEEENGVLQVPDEILRNSACS